MHAWVEVGIHTYIYGRARLPRHDLVSCFQILHFRVHCWPAAKSHTQPLFSFSLLRDVEIYDDCPPIVLKELSKFTLIGLQSWSVYTNCRLFTHANSTSKASVQLSSRIEGASAQDLPKYLIQLYWKIRASKIQNCLFSLLRDSYFFFYECFFFKIMIELISMSMSERHTSSTQGEIKNALKRSRADTSLASHP